MHIREAGSEDFDWINLGQDDGWWALMNTVMDLHVPQEERNLTSWAYYQLLKDTAPGVINCFTVLMKTTQQ